MTLEQVLERIPPLDAEAMAQAKQHWDALAKPLHGLGDLEDILVRIAGICRTPRILHGQKHVCRLLLFHALRSDIPQCMPRRTCIFRGETRARHRLKSFPDCGTTHSACCTL